MVVQKRERAMNDAEARRFFGPNLKTLMRRWLPFERCYKGREERWDAEPRSLVYRAMWRASRSRFHALARGYDVVHLNSAVLHPVVHEDLPCVIHVREIVDRNIDRVTRSLQRARGVIFIDEAARAPFAAAKLRKSIVLNNPFDMTGVGAPPANATARIGGDPAELTVFAMIGILIPEKGVDRVIRAFRGTRDPKLRLLIVGRGEQEAALRALARGDDRIVFWGHEPAIEGVFALADYVLRGEAYPCVGRTIYEALYAGCGVIVPGSEQDHTLFEYERFAARVTFYRPADEERLREAFERLAGKKLVDKRGESNAASYAAAFDAFVRESI